MPITRQLTDEELNNLEQQGIDSTGYKGKEVTLASDDELAALQATQTRPQAQPEIGKLSTIARTLKAHAGGMVGGGGAALGTVAGVGALGLAPETFGGSLLLLPLLAAAGYGGSLAGEKVQQKVLGDETQNRLEQEAQEAAAQNPITALATDITGSALASGGSLKPSNIPKAGRAIVSAIGRKAVDEVDKHALASVLINGAVNPAINSGISYATTGQLPSGKDLLSQAVGGALFSGQNRLGELASGIGQPKAEPVAEPTSKPEVKPNDVVRETPFIQKDENNNFLIDNKAINQAFSKAVPKPDTTNMSDSDRYIAETNYRKQTKVTDEQKRNFLHEAFLKKVDELDKVKIPSDNQPVTQAAPAPQPSIKPTDLVTDTETAANDLQKQLADEGNKKFAPQQNEDDFSRYNEVQARMKQLIEDKMYGGDEFAKLWKENENIKNRNGGMPPTEGNRKYAPATQKIAETQEQKDAVRSYFKDNIDKVVGQVDARYQEVLGPMAEREGMKSRIGAYIKYSALDEHPMAGDLALGFAKPFLNDTQFVRLKDVIETARKSLGYENMPFNEEQAYQMSEAKRRAYIESAYGKKKNAPLSEGGEEQSHPFKTVQEAINHIQENSTNEHYRELAESLDLDDKALGVKIGQSEHNRSYYDVDNDTIKLAKNAPEYHVMHEIIHAATSKKLQQLPENHPLIKELQSAFEEAKAQTGDKSLYGLKDVHEFVAEALTNKSFQEHLNGIQYDGKTTIWQRIVQTVSKMLGIPPKEHSMLESVMRASQELIRSERPSTETQKPIKFRESGKRIEDIIEEKPYYEDDDEGSWWINLKDGWTVDESTTVHERTKEEALSRVKDAVYKKEKTPVTSAKANGIQDAHDLLAKLALRGNLTKEELNSLKRVELNPTEKERVGREILAKRGLDDNVKFSGIDDESPYYIINTHTGEIVKEGKYKDRNRIRNLAEKWNLDYGAHKFTSSTAKSNENIKFAPKEKEIARPATGGFLGKIFRSSIDRIRDINHPAAGQVADAFHKTLNQREQYTGEQLNPILEKAHRYDIIGNDSADKRLEAAARYERETGKDGSSLLRNKGEREVFQQVRDSLKKNFEERFKNEEPVYQHGNPRMPQRDEFYWPTTTNPKIAETYRSNSKPEEIAALDKKFLDYQKKLGVSEDEATENLKNWKEAVQGSTKNIGNMGNNQYFNASRRAQGVPLPPEFTRPGFLKNIEAYFHRQAMDNAYYKHVESNPKVMSALGETLDAWKRPIEKDPTGGIAGNEAVRRQLEEFRGEVGGAGYHNEKALSSLATTLFIGPGTTVHKVLSNLVGATNYLENPYAATKFLTSMLVNADKGLAHATENGIIKLTANSSYDLLRGNLSMAEKLQALAHTVRGIYSVGDLTDRWGTGLLQAGLEGVMPRKIQRANAGDETQQMLLKRLDPDYKVGKTYDDKGISQLTSQLINSIHGTGDGRTMPPWMSGDSEVSGFFKLSHWGISQTNRFFSDVYTPATRGNIAPLMTSLFGAAVGGYIIKELREALQGKKGQIPSLQEIASSEKGLKGNALLLSYNLMAACSYAGFGGMLSQFAKLPFDKIYKNTSQGMVFPLDEVVTDMAKVLGQTTTAIANDPNLNWFELTKAIAGHFMTTNFQLGRVAINQAIDHGLIDGLPAEKKLLSDKLAELRRFNMVEGLPYNETENAGNSFNNLEQRKFQFEQNPDKIAEQLPVLINNIIKKYSSQPDVMMQKIKALKENSYTIFPSLETEPLQFGKFLEFLQKTHGKEEADKMLMDYMQHKMVNAAKSEAVP